MDIYPQYFFYNEVYRPPNFEFLNDNLSFRKEILDPEELAKDIDWIVFKLSDTESI